MTELLGPTFLVVGSPKSGGTALFEYLGQHPDVHTSPLKEPRFFAVEGNRPPGLESATWLIDEWDDYLELFRGARPDQARGEASTGYLHVAGPIERIKARLPDVRLVVILRHPAEAVWSHYLMARRDGHTTLTFEQLVDEEPLEPMNPSWSRPPNDLVRMRFYHHHLARWYEAFPADQLLVLLHDDLSDDADAVVRRTWSHLGVDPTAPLDVRKRHNVGREPRSMALYAFAKRPGANGRIVKGALRHVPGRRTAQAVVNRWNGRPPPSMPEPMRRRLLDVYRQDTTALEAMLGRDLSAWKR